MEDSITQATLCILVQGHPPQRVLLGYKKEGFGKGLYTGFGGKVEPGERVSAAAHREMREETGVEVALDDLHYVARLTFLFPQKPAWSQLVHVFLASRWSGVPTESDEMAPHWFDVDNLPYDSMWSDGRHWLPHILQGRHIRAEFVFHPDNSSLASVDFLDWENGK